MTAKIFPIEISHSLFDVNALAFLPSIEGDKEIKSEWAVFSHGYTSHKGDCLNWANRLVESGVPVIIFDQPGHYLGSFHEVTKWEDFRDHSHELFADAFNHLKSFMEIHVGVGNYPTLKNIIVGGHSLGAFNALRALELPLFEETQTLAIGIGLGMGQSQATHIFETAFYEKTISLRKQLVSPALDSTVVFSWLKTAKEEISIMGKRIHLITGEDDVVVGKGGMKEFADLLERHGNFVTMNEPKKLPHHHPGAATPHLYAFLKEQFGWK